MHVLSGPQLLLLELLKGRLLNILLIYLYYAPDNVTRVDTKLVNIQRRCCSNPTKSIGIACCLQSVERRGDHDWNNGFYLY